MENGLTSFGRGRKINMMKHTSRALVHAMLLAGTVLATPAYAAAEGTETTADNGDILVTAQRRSERLQDVPMSVTALSSEDLDRSGITSTSDLAKATPSVVIAQYGGFMQPSIRGISSAGASLENGGAKLDHGSGGEVLLRAA